MSNLIPQTVDTPEGFAVAAGGEHAVVVRESTGDAVWIESADPDDQSGAYVLVPRADLVAVASALLAAHVRLSRESKPKPVPKGK
jgi:hypothetical protein